MSYIVPFSTIQKMIGGTPRNGGPPRAVSVDAIKEVIRLLLRSVPVDEAWYRGRYEDVAAAIKAGMYRSAKHHFVEEGYFEGRLPAAQQIDERWYIRQNQDVAEGLRNGDFASAQEHFLKFGYQEGRAPAEMW
ncbi:MAG: hypothetical protein JO209_07370 [Acidisphaera sp.]|nr:hypothetical protein [Acidisphaera sp.]